MYEVKECPGLFDLPVFPDYPVPQKYYDLKLRCPRVGVRKNSKGVIVSELRCLPEDRDKDCIRKYVERITKNDRNRADAYYAQPWV
jgi:hypothetical protein